jgi:hypothetical protein
VAKLNSTGSSLLYSTLLGGRGISYGGDQAAAIAVDSSGCAYVAGETYSSNFPTTRDAFQTTLKGNTGNAFVTKLDPLGSSLIYSTFVGGSNGDRASAIAVDSAGNAYVAGWTNSRDFPTTRGAFQTSLKGVSEAFVTKLNATATALVYSTFLGGSGKTGIGDGANSIAVNAVGCACVVGQAESSDFPTTNTAFQPSLCGVCNAFITKLSASGASLVYSSLLGGSGSKGDYANAIALDSVGCAYVAGEASSADFPTTSSAFQTVPKGAAGNAFVAKLIPLSMPRLAGLSADGSVWYTLDLRNWIQIPGSLSSLVFGSFVGDDSRDLAGIASDSSLLYTTNLMTWTKMNKSLKSLVTGYFGGTGSEGIAGVGADGSVWHTVDLLNWTRLPGSLDLITAQDFSGRGRWGLAGIASDDSIWLSPDLLTWRNIPGQLSTVVPGGFAGSGKDGLAGLGEGGSIWYTSDLTTWRSIPGELTSLVTGDFMGTGKAGIAGLASDGTVWYTTDLANWSNIPGCLASLTVGELDDDRKDDLAGLATDGSIWYTTDLQTWTKIPGQLSLLVSRGRQ